ncbi:glycoside hydrolase family 88 protein [Ningiella sp. W23]|uniref:glycoside hydrolase family 88 protein n=1 Tax=Ningiella sp. W23 TaxID=3023715 RepID=UPI0037572B02
MSIKRPFKPAALAFAVACAMSISACSDSPDASQSSPYGQAVDKASSEASSSLASISDNKAFCAATLDYSASHLDHFRKTYTDPTQIPRSFEKEVKLVETRDWTSGFVAGSFWYLYEHTNDPSWLASAQEWTHALESQQFNVKTHDTGFMIFNSYGNGLRLTDNQDYIPIIVQTARSLMQRYNPVVGATRSWDFGTWEFPVIVDNMMNLELLFEAAKLADEQSFADAAVSHATVTMNNHFRDDYSSFHVVDYSTTTGEAIHKQTWQGIADDSDWARGQGWGLYGYVMMYRYTQDQSFLDFAKNITEHYLSHENMPDDLVPYFDFDAPDDPEVINYRDSSTAALVASALFELATYVEQDEAKRYEDAAMKMLRSLAGSDYLAQKGENGQFLLKQATGNFPGGYELAGALNYADYYYLEALTRCKKMM